MPKLQERLERDIHKLRRCWHAFAKARAAQADKAKDAATALRLCGADESAAGEVRKRAAADIATGIATHAETISTKLL